MTATEEARLIAGRYLLIAEVGRGAMGVVWRGRDERLGRTVAVKELRPGVGMSGTQVRHSYLRARREARIAASLQHPNAVAVYDVADHDERPYLIMEYVPSHSLAEVLVERTVLDPLEAVEIGAQMASALVAAHEIGIVHRDVKPANILLAENGVAKLTDFGISRAAGDVTVTATGEMLGTPAYVAPEIAQGRAASAASDVFSLGATLYAAVEGVPPFGTGPSAIALLLRIVNDEIRPPEQQGPLTDTLMWMLRNDPADRPSMEAARRSLRAVAASLSPPEVHVTPGPAERPEPEAEVANTLLEPADSGSGDEAEVAVASASEQPPSGLANTKTSTYSRRRMLLPWWAWLGLVALVTAGIVAALVASSGSGGSGGSTTPPVTSTTQTTRATTTTSAKSKTTTSATSRTSTSAAGAATASASGSATASASSTASVATQLSSAISHYYTLVPGNLNEAFGYMTPYYQQNTAKGMTGYEDFWDQIQSVTVSNIVAQPPSTVTATIDYHYKNGQTVQEQTTFGLVFSDGIWKIASSSVQSSTTL